MSKEFISSSETFKVMSHFLHNNSTVRQTANALDMPKTRVHIILREFVPIHYPYYYGRVDQQLCQNLLEASSRGGRASAAKHKKNA